MRSDAVTTTISRCAKLSLEEDAELQAMATTARMSPDDYVTMLVRHYLPGTVKRAVDNARKEKP